MLQAVFPAHEGCQCYRQCSLPNRGANVTGSVPIWMDVVTVRTETMEITGLLGQ